ncbi:protochlorophyllide reductase [Actinokineospora alba]|uniref:Protochlorophyllide reductase n=1 Tax=Actinokineospora alba TaxID=504798 RepID=A0A1H0JS14_9PSEU|nr:oxidoreductase [Actinokineospora alba]TDP68186.1 protochlorophyllide reductase [Actinokineospora alba]SDH93846.1 protochlorophyllide reductase [Actinokineospora alba]SDO46516.1 protochlorophyllide reductase [Actinokineospora alba]
MTWSEADLPDLGGRTVLITGANSGLGLRSAQVLAAKGAHVFVGARSLERGRAAIAAIDGAAELLEIDLADLASVRKAAAEVRERTGDRLDVLMNNAGVMGTPKATTADGFELQIGTNHLGHAALTWLLMPALRGVPDARVVTLSSIAHRSGRIDVDDLNFERRGYNAAAAYAQSKLANLLFAIELDRRLLAAGETVISVAAHPGMTETDLAVNSARLRVPGPLGGAVSKVVSLGNKLITQSVERGALPQLYAATAPDVRGGEYFGPTGPGEVFGAPGRAKPRAAAVNPDLGRTLWQRSADLTGVSPDPE